MMPDLGKYAVQVLSAYGVSVVLLVGLVGLSLRAARHAAADLKDAEERRQKDG
ncbi:MAG: heme exporter protein CcmD [Mangrovicoccus sp.]